MTIPPRPNPAALGLQLYGLRDALRLIEEMRREAQTDPARRTAFRDAGKRIRARIVAIEQKMWQEPPRT